MYKPVNIWGSDEINIGKKTHHRICAIVCMVDLVLEVYIETVLTIYFFTWNSWVEGGDFQLFIWKMIY